MGTQLSSPPPKGVQPPIFGPCLLWPNGWMYQDATWYGGKLQPRPIVLDGDPTPHPPKGGTASPNFRPMSIVAKRSPVSAAAEQLFIVSCQATSSCCEQLSTWEAALNRRSYGNDIARWLVGV